MIYYRLTKSPELALFILKLQDDDTNFHVLKTDCDMKPILRCPILKLGGIKCNVCLHGMFQYF